MNNKKNIYHKIVEYLIKQGVVKVAIFGSYARNEEKPESDIDVLVSFSETKSLLELARIERKLSEIVGIKLNITTENALNPYIKDEVLEEMKEIYRN